MAGVQYSTASYVTHVLKGLPSSYSLMKRMLVVPSTRATLNEDSLTSYILKDEAMQEAEQSMELLPQANYVAPAKQGGRPEQCGKPSGGGSSGGAPTKYADKQRLAMDSGRRRGERRRVCWLCGDPDHLFFECPDRSDFDDDDAKEGRERSASRRPCWNSNLRKEKKSSNSASVKGADSFAGGTGRDNKEASWSRPSRWHRRPARTSRRWSCSTAAARTT
ncbi:unnamed protein product [Closterium sp. NIES-53]